MVKRNPRKPKDRDNSRAGVKKSSLPSSDPSWLYGFHTVLAALRNPHRQIKRVVTTKKGGDRLRNSLKENGNFEIVDSKAIEDLLPPGSIHQGIALLAAPLEPPTIETLIKRISGAACIVVLDQVKDPQNVGSIMRSAAAFGAEALIVQARHAPGVTGALAKAASGAVETIPMVPVTNLTRGLETLKEASFWCVGLDAAAKNFISDINLDGRIALVMGAEDTGLRRLTRKDCDLLARLPTKPEFDTLNVSAAATVALYETARQQKS